MTNEQIRALKASAEMAAGNDEYGVARRALEHIANPELILSLLAEREADKALIAEQAKRIAELEARTSNAWITHDGLSRPRSLGKNDLVYLKTRKQELNIPYPAGIAKSWFHSGGDMDIVAYRPAKARALTVKLPDEKFCPAEYSGSQLWEETEIWNQAISACETALKKSCDAQGITLVVGGE